MNGVSAPTGPPPTSLQQIDSIEPPSPTTAPARASCPQAKELLAGELPGLDLTYEQQVLVLRTVVIPGTVLMRRHEAADHELPPWQQQAALAELHNAQTVDQGLGHSAQPVHGWGGGPPGGEWDKREGLPGNGPDTKCCKAPEG